MASNYFLSFVSNKNYSVEKRNVPSFVVCSIAQFILHLIAPLYFAFVCAIAVAAQDRAGPTSVEKCYLFNVMYAELYIRFNDVEVMASFGLEALLPLTYTCAQ